MGDNQFLSCPAMMSDTRFLSTKQSSQVIVDAIKRSNGFNLCQMNNDDFRMFMQNNAVPLMDQERRFILRNNRCQIPRAPIVIELPFEK